MGEKEVACKESQQRRLKNGAAAQAQGVAADDRCSALAHYFLGVNKF